MHPRILSMQKAAQEFLFVIVLVCSLTSLTGAVPTRPRWMRPCAGSTTVQPRGPIEMANSTLDLRRHYTIMAERATSTKAAIQELRNLYASERYAIPNPELKLSSMPVVEELNGMDISSPQEEEILQTTFSHLAQSIVHLMVSRQGEALYEQGHFVGRYNHIENELYWHMCAIHIGMNNLHIDLPANLEETVNAITFMDNPSRAQRHMIDSVILRDISKILHKSEHQFQLLSSVPR